MTYVIILLQGLTLKMIEKKPEMNLGIYFVRCYKEVISELVLWKLSFVPRKWSMAVIV